MSQTPRQTTAGERCRGCSGLLGDLEPGQTVHPLCEWATAEDWLALVPWVDGMHGVRIAGR